MNVQLDAAAMQRLQEQTRRPVFHCPRCGHAVRSAAWLWTCDTCDAYGDTAPSRDSDA